MIELCCLLREHTFYSLHNIDILSYQPKGLEAANPSGVFATFASPSSLYPALAFAISPAHSSSSSSPSPLPLMSASTSSGPRPCLCPWCPPGPESTAEIGTGTGTPALAKPRRSGSRCHRETDTRSDPAPGAPECYRSSLGLWPTPDASTRGRFAAGLSLEASLRLCAGGTLKAVNAAKKSSRDSSMAYSQARPDLAALLCAASNGPANRAFGAVLDLF